MVVDQVKLIGLFTLKGLHTLVCLQLVKMMSVRGLSNITKTTQGHIHFSLSILLTLTKVILKIVWPNNSKRFLNFTVRHRGKKVCLFLNNI